MSDVTSVLSGQPRLILNEAQLVQNTALASVLMWLFVRSYNQVSEQPCVLPLCFTVLPILYHHATRSAAETTIPSSSLAKFVEKFDSERDQLLALHDRALALRPLSLRSLQLAAAKGLVALSVEDATVLTIRTAALTDRVRPERLRPMLRAAEKLGGWYAPHTISNISATLRVFF